MKRILIGTVATLALAGCGGGAGSNAPVKRQPGSWSSSIEIVKLEGPDIKPGTREQMQQMFSMMGAMSVCITPEAAAREDVSKNLENSAGSRDCKFDKQNVSGATVEFSGTCEQNGKKVRMTANGSNGATTQDITMKIEPLNAAGAAEGVMEMRVTSKRNGECKPGDITPPATPAGPSAKP
jgi:hypothetical protein